MLQQYDSIKVKGDLIVKKYSSTEDLNADLPSEYREVKNMVVDMGKRFIASRIKDNTKSPITHMAIGLGGTAPAASDETLSSECVRMTIPLAVQNGKSLTYEGIFPS